MSKAIELRRNSGDREANEQNSKEHVDLGHFAILGKCSGHELSTSAAPHSVLSSKYHALASPSPTEKE